jgi:hypothetical protein
MHEKNCISIFKNNKNYPFVFLKVIFFFRLHFIKIVINDHTLRRK